MDFSPKVWRIAMALALLGVLLIGLKLFGVIGAAWWLVLLPFAPLLILPLILLWAILAWISSGGH